LTKIRLVAVTLLDAVPARAYDDPSVQGMAAYLLGKSVIHICAYRDGLLCDRFPEHNDIHRGSIRRLRHVVTFNSTIRHSCWTADDDDDNAADCDATDPSGSLMSYLLAAGLPDPLDRAILSHSASNETIEIASGIKYGSHTMH